MNIALIKVESLVKKSTLSDQEKEYLLNVVKRIPTESLEGTFDYLNESPENIASYYNDFKNLEEVAGSSDSDKLQQLIDQKIEQIG